MRAYRDLEREGIVGLKHESGVFVRASVVAWTEPMRKAEPILATAVDSFESLDLTEREIRRLMENDRALRRTAGQRRKKSA